MEDSAHTTHHHWVEVAVAKIAVEKIAVEVRPREPSFEKCSHLREKCGGTGTVVPTKFSYSCFCTAVNTVVNIFHNCHKHSTNRPRTRNTAVVVDLRYGSPN